VEPEKSITEHLDDMLYDMLDEVKEDSGFIVNGSNGRKYRGDTPHEAIEKMKAGEQAHFEIEQAEIQQKAEMERMRVLADAKNAGRKWKIDNVTLTDEEYEEVEKYMESIKHLWQTW